MNKNSPNDFGLFKLDFGYFEKVMKSKVSDKYSVEIQFEVESSEIYNLSWMGKSIERETNREVFWFGLVEDGSQAYDYETFDEFVNSQVFYGEKSLKDLWDLILIFSLNGANESDIINVFLKFD